MRCRHPLILAAAVALAAPAAAESPADVLAAFEREARAADPAFAGFSAARGRAFFLARHGTDWSCATCHGEDPAQPGRHATTGKAIAPLAPAADPQRFTDPRKVEKWFRRNCNDVLERACTAQEKGDVLGWLLTVRK